MYLLGIDLGSSSVKASVVDAETGKCMVSAMYPKKEMEIMAGQTGWAEQDPEVWYKHVRKAVWEIISLSSVEPAEISAIGISYQMHGLVMVDRELNVIRPSIIWCDSRAVDIGRKAFQELGPDRCLKSLLNSPGNFTASKLKWVKDHEPELYEKIYKIMLPGDYIAMKLTGEVKTTISGLSEGIFWDFRKNELAGFLMDYYGLNQEHIPEMVPTFSVQGKLTAQVAEELGLQVGTPVSYRAGDQPNNAFSLKVLNPGEIAATAGTSGVVYGISNEVKYDLLSRVNTFAHVNHDSDKPRLGVLLCINGTGILNAWIKNHAMPEALSYAQMNEMAQSIPIGSEGLTVLPFGNGAERIFENRNIHSHILGLDFNIHRHAHLLRAAQEGIVFSFVYGMDIMKEMGIIPSVIRAGKSNMFLSRIFTHTLATLSGATIELYNTDGSQGAARAAGIGAGIYAGPDEAFANLKITDVIEPESSMQPVMQETYGRWLHYLHQFYHHEQNDEEN